MSGALISETQWLQERQLADFDRLLSALRQWIAHAPSWPPFQQAQSLFARIEPRLRELQVNLDRVLVVGLVGGSGTGKSTLVNALVGQRICIASDVQRPTTTHPVVLCHTDVDPSFLRLEDCEPELHRLHLPLLENMVLVDCPDPDTQGPEGRDAQNRNRETLRRVLPQCDVMLCVGTAQKYATHAVLDEVLRHAPGRQAVFIQTHAATDSDIREDWQRRLEAVGFASPLIFRIDSEQALERQEQGQPPPEEFQDLTRFLRQELAGRARRRIKRANVLDLVDWLLKQIQEDIAGSLPPLLQLEEAIEAQRQKLMGQVKTRLTERIRGNQHLWRTRLLRQVTLSWGGGPFAAFLWLVGSINGLMRLVPIARARSLIPLLVAGGYAAGKSLTDRWRESLAADEWVAGAELGIGEADLAQSRAILEGYAQAAGIHLPGPAHDSALSQESLIALARRLYQEVESALEQATERRVARKAGAVLHFFLELAFLIVPGYLIYHVARNFFYEHLYLKTAPPLGVEFWLQAAIWTFLWGFLLRGLLIARLRSGLKRDINQLLENWSARELLTGLFDDLALAARQRQEYADALQPLAREVANLRDQFGQVTQWKLGEETAARK